MSAEAPIVIDMSAVIEPVILPIELPGMNMDIAISAPYVKLTYSSPIKLALSAPHCRPLVSLLPDGSVFVSGREEYTRLNMFGRLAIGASPS
jgi:hypothetical protein